jgi:hypothetical protein
MFYATVCFYHNVNSEKNLGAVANDLGQSKSERQYPLERTESV